MEVLQDQELKKKILGALKEVSSAMSRIETERDDIKDIIKDISEEAGIDKRVFRKICRCYHKQNYQDEIASQEEFQLAYESVVK